MIKTYFKTLLLGLLVFLIFCISCYVTLFLSYAILVATKLEFLTVGVFLIVFGINFASLINAIEKYNENR